MGELYSVYHGGDVPTEALDYFAKEYRLDRTLVSSGRAPTFAELRSAIEKLDGYVVSYSTIAGSWLARISHIDDPAETTTVVVSVEHTQATMAAPLSFHFERGSTDVMTALLIVIAAQCGPLILHPHTSGFILLVREDGGYRRYDQSGD